VLSVQSKATKAGGLANKPKNGTWAGGAPQWSDTRSINKALASIPSTKRRGTPICCVLLSFLPNSLFPPPTLEVPDTAL
jgi:hypothetical protein